MGLQRRIEDLSRRVAAAENEVEEAKREREDAQAQADKEALQAALGEVNEQLSTLLHTQEQHDQLAEARTARAEEVASLRGANEAMAPETEPLKQRVAILEGAEEPTCPTCGQPLTEEHRAQLVAETQAEIEARRQKYRENQAQIKKLTAEAQALEKQVAALEGLLRQRPGFEKRAGELEVALNHAEDAARLANTLEARIARWKEAIEADRRERSELSSKADEYNKRLGSSEVTQKDVDQLRFDKRMADEGVGSARQKLATLDSHEKQKRERLREREQMAQGLGLYEDLREAFSKRGVPAMIIETVVPELERSANELLGRLTDGRLHVRIETQREIKTGELREALDIIISDELGSRPYELYSGGEAFRIDFAIRIALSKLLANRAGAQLRSLFIDEGFGTQDARGREQLLEAINTIQDDFDRILVITHIEELKDAFPARIEVRKTPEGSQFELA